MEIKYTQENIDLLQAFTTPLTVDDYGYKSKWFNQYKDDIKGFIQEQLNITITTYGNEHSWFYLIETKTDFYHSDECDHLDLTDYNMALNRAIKYIFNNILNFSLD